MPFRLPGIFVRIASHGDNMLEFNRGCSKGLAGAAAEAGGKHDTSLPMPVSPAWLLSPTKLKTGQLPTARQLRAPSDRCSCAHRQAA